MLASLQPRPISGHHGECDRPSANVEFTSQTCNYVLSNIVHVFVCMCVSKFSPSSDLSASDVFAIAVGLLGMAAGARPGICASAVVQQLRIVVYGGIYVAGMETTLKRTAH